MSDFVYIKESIDPAKDVFGKFLSGNYLCRWYYLGYEKQKSGCHKYHVDVSIASRGNASLSCRTSQWRITFPSRALSPKVAKEVFALLTGIAAEIESRLEMHE